MKKKGLLLIMFTFLSMGVYSQITFNTKIGLNVSNWSGDWSSAYTPNETTKTKVGYKLGVGMEYTFSNMLSVEPAVLLSSKGMRVTGSAPYIKSYDLTINQMYIEMPINALLRIPIYNKLGVMIAVGPYFAYGIAGDAVSQTLWQSGTFSEESVKTFGSGENDLNFNRFDMGINAGVTLELVRFSLGVEGQYGLTKLRSDFNDNPKNVNYCFTVGYKF